LQAQCRGVQHGREVGRGVVHVTSCATWCATVCIRCTSQQAMGFGGKLL
jgi:hypothetical protein